MNKHTTDMQTFDFHHSEVRVIVDETGEPWFVGKDVANVLGYMDAYGALKKHVDDDDKQNCQNDSFESPRGMTVINESGLYSLVLSSKLPSAKEFKKWVTSEVLPSIRKHGGYMAGQEHMSPEEIVLASVNWLQSVVDEQKRQIEAQKPKVVFADALTASKKDILVGELAKILKQNGIEIGQNRLFAWLREHGWLMKRNGIRNFPTQKAQDMGLFFVKAKPVTLSDGSTITSYTTKVTPKGQLYFINKFLEGDL